MLSGYNLSWTSQALSELDAIYTQMESTTPEADLRSFSRQLNNTLELLARNPFLFQSSAEHPEIRRAMIPGNHSIYYVLQNRSICILSLSEHIY